MKSSTQLEEVVHRHATNNDGVADSLAFLNVHRPQLTTYLDTAKDLQLKTIMKYWSILLLSLCGPGQLLEANAFSLRLPSSYFSVAPDQTSDRLQVLFAARTPNNDESGTITKSPDQSVTVELVASDNENFLNMVGSFLVDSFWLSSEHHKLGDSSTISPEARMSLIVEQCADLQEKFGETMGRRLFDTCVFGALDSESKEMLGAATVKVSLLMGEEILEPENAETIAKNAVASLGPKQRRLYRDASIADELLSPNTRAVCVLSNLAVSTKVRRQGIAQILCKEAELLAKDWGFNAIHLLVEKENAAARALYEGRLGYTTAFEEESVPALRVNLESGTFEEIKVDTVILSKQV